MWCDVPRYFELLRNGIVESACVYTSMTGFSNYYIGIGNDIGYDAANGYPQSIPSDLTPHYGSGPGYINTITAPRKLAMTYLGGLGWWSGLPWLGELYPDSMASTFFDAPEGAGRGNLPAGNTVGTVFQYASQTAYLVAPRSAYGTRIFNNHQRTWVNGCASFFNIGTANNGADGSVDIYFGPTPPEGKESNWLPTDPKRRFFLLARFYGPEPALFDGSFELNDIEKPS